ncbi:hypothetical protein D9M68_786750 [compost metagenome]
MAEQVVAAEQLHGLAVTCGIEPRHVPAHPGQGVFARVAAEQTRGALAGHAVDAEAFQAFQALAAHLRAAVTQLGGAIAARRAEQHQAAHPRCANAGGVGHGHQRAEGMAHQQAVVHVQRLQQQLQARGVVGGLRPGLRQRRGQAVARRVPGDHPALRGQAPGAMQPGGRARANAVQQHHHRALTTFANGHLGAVGQLHQALGEALLQVRGGAVGLRHVHCRPQRLMLARGCSGG